MDKFTAVKNEVEKEILTEDNELKAKFLNDKDKKEAVDCIAKLLIEKYKFKTVGEMKNVIYAYGDGIYAPDGKNIIKKEVEKTLEELATNYHTAEIIGKIERRTITKREEFEKENINLICVDNGVLNFQTGELLPHNPNYVFLSKIPVDYNSGADCPKIKEFFKSIFYKEDVGVIEEWCGYVLYRKYLFKKAIILEGYKDTGKTTFLNLLTKFTGEKNISEISLQKLTRDRFASASLYGKHLNLYDDLDAGDISNSGILKIITGGGRLPAEIKFGDYFHFENFAKLIFATNQIPSVKNMEDDAYFGRWMIIKCDNIFDEEKRDQHILEKLTTPSELSGLLNYSIQGLERLLKNGKFSYTKTLNEVKDIIQRSSSSLSAFVQDKLVRKDSHWISKKDLYDAYTEYTTEKELTPLSIEKVGRDLRKFAYYIVDSKSENITGWRNVSFKNGGNNNEPLNPQELF